MRWRFPELDFQRFLYLPLEPFAWGCNIFVSSHKKPSLQVFQWLVIPETFHFSLWMFFSCWQTLLEIFKEVSPTYFLPQFQSIIYTPGWLRAGNFDLFFDVKIVFRLAGLLKTALYPAFLKDLLNFGLTPGIQGNDTIFSSLFFWVDTLIFLSIEIIDKVI